MSHTTDDLVIAHALQHDELERVTEGWRNEILARAALKAELEGVKEENRHLQYLLELARELVTNQCVELRRLRRALSHS